MTVVEIRKQEDCFDGTLMKEVVLDGPITRQFILYWDPKGVLEYFPSFARPFFKVEVKGHYYIKGIEGNRYLSLILYKTDPEKSLAQFKADVAAFPG